MKDEKFILLVEDNPDDQTFTLLSLKENHILNRVVVAHDGAEALGYLLGKGEHADRRLENLPTLIMLDLKLPKIDGLEVLQNIRSDPRTRLLPVVILTSSKEQQDLVASYNLGANSYVSKPVDFAQFSDAIRQLGLYWLILNLPPPVQ